MKTYMVYRKNDHVTAYVVSGDSRSELTHYPHHSPTGFEYGYEGSGPADLALAILADHFGETPTKDVIRRGGSDGVCKDCDGRKCSECEYLGYKFYPLECWAHHQMFKREFIGRAKSTEPFMISQEQIEDWLRAAAA